MRSFVKLRSLFATAMGVAACGPSEVDHSELTGDTCTGAPIYEPLAGVTPGTPVDYIELRETFGSSGTPMILAGSGSPCASATNVPVCSAALDAATSPGWQLAPSGGLSPITNVYLVYTRGDTVATIDTYDALKTFLAPIDNIHDAALLVAEDPDARYTIECGPNTGGPVGDGYELVADTGDTCGQGTHEDQVLLSVSGAGDVTVKQDVVIKNGDPNCVSGRRPEGLAPHARTCDDALGAFFAECAYLEAASVPAFERLARELRAHGAPTRFVKRALRARADEVRHAKATAALARRRGASPDAVVVELLPIRSLLAIAIENAVEGQVRETYGALVAVHQAAHARDARVAAVMRHIAADETRHAALAWDLAEWLDSQLTDEERRLVARARDEAVATLRSALAAPVAHDLEHRAGIPSPAKARAMLDVVAPSLWAA
jgi:hypothetical protein